MNFTSQWTGCLLHVILVLWQCLLQHTSGFMRSFPESIHASIFSITSRTPGSVLQAEQHMCMSLKSSGTLGR